MTFKHVLPERESLRNYAVLRARTETVAAAQALHANVSERLDMSCATVL